MELTPAAPTLRELLIAKFGKLTCRHDYRVIQAKTRIYLKCQKCDQETEGFRVAGTKD